MLWLFAINALNLPELEKEWRMTVLRSGFVKNVMKALIK
jgi:hypothetical protein